MKGKDTQQKHDAISFPNKTEARKVFIDNLEVECSMVGADTKIKEFKIPIEERLVLYTQYEKVPATMNKDEYEVKFKYTNCN